MIIFANAKINLGLKVIGKRADGFHNIETVFYPVPFYDVLEIIHNDAFEELISFGFSGIEINDAVENNLCYKAYKQLQPYIKSKKLAIHLHKKIPPGTGLGGGSSDAAFTLTGINSLLNLQLTDQQLSDLALDLGSDCSFFIRNKPAFATGRGEKLSPLNIDLSGRYLVILHPGIHVSTKEAYASLGHEFSSNADQQPTDLTLNDLEKIPVEQWKDLVFNDFESFVFSKFPLISDLKNALYELGAVFALMSGSGSAVYGIFNGRPEWPDEIKKYMLMEGMM